MLYDGRWARVSQERPFLTTGLVALLFLAAALTGGPGSPLAGRFALAADNPGGILFYWLFHTDWTHWWVNVFLLAAAGGFLEVAGGWRRWLLALVLGFLGGGFLYWLGARLAPELFPAAVGASIGGYALLIPVFYSLLKVFHAGVLLRVGEGDRSKAGPAAARRDPAAGAADGVSVAWTGPLYGLMLLLAAVVGIPALSVAAAAGAGAGHLLGYGLGCLLAAEFWWRDFPGGGGGGEESGDSGSQ